MPPPDRKPTAKLTGPTSAVVGVMFIVDPTGSSDGQGGIKQWEVRDSTGVVHRDKGKGALALADVVLDQVGPIDVSLTVWDARWNSDTAHVTVDSTVAVPVPQPVDCKWSEWTLWSDWTSWVDTGNGTESRTRTRARGQEPPASTGGKPCVGDPTETQTETRPIVVPIPDADCVLSDEILVSEREVVACGPGDVKKIEVTWRKDLIKPATGNGTCGPQTGARVEDRPCQYVPPTQPAPGELFYALQSQEDIAKYVAPGYVAYDPAMNAARVTVPVWPTPVWPLETALSDAETVIGITMPSKTGWVDRSLKFTDTGEIVTVDSYTQTDAGGGKWRYGLTVLRAQRGTAKARHEAGATFQVNANSLRTQLRVPLKTTDGHAYLFQYEFYLTPACLGADILVPRKSFQLESNNIWLEQNIATSGQIPDPARPGHTKLAPGFDKTKHVGVMVFRSYNQLGGSATWQPFATDPARPALQCGPNVVAREPLAPQVGFMILEVNRWYRPYILIQQRANDYDVMSSWIANSDTVVQMHNGLLLNVRPQSIHSLWCEWNSSDDKLYALAGLRTSYFRGVRQRVVDPATVAPLLVKV